MTHDSPTNERLIRLRKYAELPVAELARQHLEAAGISSRVDNVATGGWLSHLGERLASFSLYVLEEDAPRARELLAEIDDEESQPEWVCESCGADVDAGFDECWSCGASRTSSVD